MMAETRQHQDILGFMPKWAKITVGSVLGVAVLVWSFGPGALVPCVLAAPLFVLLGLASRRRAREPRVEPRRAEQRDDQFLV
jgi:hypothetical protein